MDPSTISLRIIPILSQLRKLRCKHSIIFRNVFQLIISQVTYLKMYRMFWNINYRTVRMQKVCRLYRYLETIWNQKKLRLCRMIWERCWWWKIVGQVRRLLFCRKRSPKNLGDNQNEYYDIIRMYIHNYIYLSVFSLILSLKPL